ncbi:hypothetical protein ACE6H2_017875 [Prunus campanulata]
MELVCSDSAFTFLANDLLVLMDKVFSLKPPKLILHFNFMNHSCKYQQLFTSKDLKYIKCLALGHTTSICALQ